MFRDILIFIKSFLRDDFTPASKLVIDTRDKKIEELICDCSIKSTGKLHLDLIVNVAPVERVLQVRLNAPSGLQGIEYARTVCVGGHAPSHRWQMRIGDVEIDGCDGMHICHTACILKAYSIESDLRRRIK